MGAGKKVAIGCGGLLLLVFLAVFLGYRWVQNNHGFTWKDEEVVAIATEALPIVVPERFDPMFAGYMEEGLKDPMAFFLDEGSRSNETYLTFFSRTGSFTYEQMVAEYDSAEGEGSGLRIQVGKDIEGEEERFPALYREREVEVILQEGLDENQILQRSLVTIIPEDGRTVMVILKGPADSLPSSTMQELLGSTR